MHDRSTVLLLPNAWDAATARLLAHLDFAAVATTSGGVAWSLGYADGEHAPLEEVLGVIGRIAQAVSLPVTADIEAGYGTTPRDVERTISAVVEAGAVGINLEDSRQTPHALRDMQEAADRIRAARAAADSAGVAIVINARVDTYALKFGQSDAERFDETVRRAQAYLAAGADCIFPITLADEQTLASLVAAIDAPINVVAHPAMPSISRLGQLGVARISTASHLAAIALGAVAHAAKTLRDTGRFEALESTLSRKDIQHLMETPPMEL